MNGKTNIGLVEYCERQIGKPYWFGCFGQVSTKSLYEEKRKAYPSYYTANNFLKQLNVKVHDCIGLVKGYMWCSSPEDTKPKYCSNGFPDVSADMQFNRSKRKGTYMRNMPEVKGILVFMKGHVGVYVGDGWVIEARGHAYGVVKTRLKDRPWTKWAFVDEIEYVEQQQGQQQGNGGKPSLTSVSCNMK